MSNNMKTYVPTLILFFLLLVDKSVAPPNLGKLINTLVGHGRRVTNNAKKNRDRERLSRPVEDIIENIIENIGPPPPPNAPPVKINGLRYLKEYLSDYGYIPPSDSFDDYQDQETVSAIDKYQQFYNLTATGSLDNETRQQISHLRCAVPDVKFGYDFTAVSNNLSFSWPLGTRWFPNGSKNLTYGFAPVSKIPGSMKNVFRDSFKRWSDAIRVLNLTETTSYDDADIKIGFYLFDNKTIGFEVVAVSLIELQSDVTYGSMLLDASKLWAVPSDNASLLSWEDGVVDLGTVAMHQIGHLLGLQHSSHAESVMYPYILPTQQRKVELSNHDKDQVQQVYSSSAVTLVGPGLGLLTHFVAWICMHLLGIVIGF